jgi:hypothetical protein
MLQFINRTPFVGALTLFPDPDGIDTVYAVVKGTFTLGNDPRVADVQVPIVAVPEFHGDPADSSVKRPSDVSLSKPATDIVVLGYAVAPNGNPVTVMDVFVTLGSVSASARVFGDRVWETNGATYSASAPRSFDRMPLVWERSFGGTDDTPNGATGESRNPVGTGFRAANGVNPIEGTRLPNVETINELITSWKQVPTPAGFAPTAAHWEPRRSYAGTYDQAWQDTRCPYLPQDFDPRFLQIAPPGLIAPGHLHGGETGELRGLTLNGSQTFALPTTRPRVEFVLDGEHVERPVELDTVVLEPSENRLSLVWRAALPCDKKALRVKTAVATLERD